MKKTGNGLRRDLCVLVLISIFAFGLMAILSSCATPRAPTPSEESGETSPPTIPITSPSSSTSPSSGNECIAPNDNWNLQGTDKCALADTEWFQGLTIFKAMEDKIKQWRSLRSPEAPDYVYLAVVDSGGVDLDKNCKKIKEEGRYRSVMGKDLKPWHPGGLNFSHMHTVTALIAADNDGKGMNGLASGILEQRLFLVLADHSYAYNYRTILEKAVKSDQDIVSDIVLLSNFDEVVTDNEWSYIVDIISKYSETLFVIPAADRYVKLVLPDPLPDLKKLKENKDEACLGTLDNVVMVGGTSKCNPIKIGNGSAYGPGINIVAPYEDIPLVDEFGTPFRGWGNCYSAPQVASLAAVLKYIDPLLTPKQIKMIMRDSSWALTQTSADKEQWHPVLSFARAIAQTIIFQASCYEPALIKKLTFSAEPVYLFPEDPNGQMIPIVLTTGLIMPRICDDSVDYKVDSYGDHELTVFDIFFDPDVPFSPRSAEGGIKSDNFAFWVTSAGPVKLEIAGYDGFGLGIDYPINDSHDTGVSVSYNAAMSGILGTGIEGTVTFKSCQIHDRYAGEPFTNAPWHVSFEGRIEGTLEMMDISSSSVINHANIIGNFKLPFQIAYDSNELCTYLEQQCAGGFGECMMVK